MDLTATIVRFCQHALYDAYFSTCDYYSFFNMWWTADFWLTEFESSDQNYILREISFLLSFHNLLTSVTGKNRDFPLHHKAARSLPSTLTAGIWDLQTADSSGPRWITAVLPPTAAFSTTLSTQYLRPTRFRG
jgi:hypothetical protein